MGLLSKKETEPGQEPVELYDGPTWEYKAMNLNWKASIAFEAEFNKLGAQGWEFVAVASRDNVHRAIFKRQRR
jgi:hypothetical protein